jgi:putative NADH-flavin reductase
MASSPKLRVAVAGAPGETGQSIRNGLLAEPAKLNVTALVQHEAVSKPEYQEMAHAGATLGVADYYDVEAFAARLTGADDVISCILPPHWVESETLIDAGHRASVGRFVVSFFSTFMPPRGVMEVHGLREDLLDRYRRLSHRCRRLV